MSLKISEQVAAENSSGLLKRIQDYAFGSPHPATQEIYTEESHSESHQDILLALKSNISHLADVSQRLDFMMDEVASLIKRR